MLAATAAALRCAVQIQYVLDKAGSKGQIAIIVFLIVVLILLVFLAVS